MFNKTFNTKKFFPVDRTSLFKYWIRPDLLEQWSSPKGMELKILYLEERPGGKFHYRYHANEKVYDLNGHLEELVPNEKIVMIDSLKAPNGKVVYEKQTTTINFKSVPGGTEVSIQQEGFPSEDYFKLNEENWNLGTNKLSNLISSETKRAAA